MIRTLLSWLLVTVGWSYLCVVLFVPVLWFREMELSRGLWWPAYLCAELLALGVPPAIAIVFFVRRSLRRSPSVKPGVFGRVMGLIGLALIPPFVLFVVPVGLMESLLEPTSTIAASWWLGIALTIATAFWAYARYVWRPRHPEIIERLQLAKEERSIVQR